MAEADSFLEPFEVQKIMQEELGNYYEIELVGRSESNIVITLKLCAEYTHQEFLVDLIIPVKWPSKGQVDVNIKSDTFTHFKPKADVLSEIKRPKDLVQLCAALEKACGGSYSAFDDMLQAEEAGTQQKEPVKELNLYELLDDDDLVKAATAIYSAEVILIGTGAGYSADSGLATYPGVANLPAYNKRNITYFDICNPVWFSQDPAMGFGFWGYCANSYRDTVPHDGYKIFRKWKDTFFMKNNRILKDFEEIMTETLSTRNMNDIHGPITKVPFFSLTSNVDAHWWNPNVGAVFDQSEVTEIHGNTEYWQTSCAHINYSQEPVTFRLDPEFRFEVDMDTMLASDKRKWPKDPKYNTPARPNVLMFGDCDWNDPYDDKFGVWANNVKSLFATDKYGKNVPRVVVIEIGAGQRVPSIRAMSRTFAGSTNATFIRVNPDSECLKKERFSRGKVGSYMPFKSTGLAFLKKMDCLLDHFQESEAIDFQELEAINSQELEKI